MKTAIQSASAGLLALTLGALCLADSATPPVSAKPPASAAKGKWKSSVGTTTVEGLPAKHIASLPDLVVVPVEGAGPSGSYYGFKVTNVGRSATESKSMATLSFQCWKYANGYYWPASCPIASVMIGPLAPRSSSQVVQILVVRSNPSPAEKEKLAYGWRFEATVDKQNSIPESNETNNIAQWVYEPPAPNLSDLPQPPF